MSIVLFQKIFFPRGPVVRFVSRPSAAIESAETSATPDWTIFIISGIFIWVKRREMARIDKYEVIEEIARGGMGAVYKALHPQFKKIIAIKEVRADLANNPDILQRFEQEVELLAQLP